MWIEALDLILNKLKKAELKFDKSGRFLEVGSSMGVFIGEREPWTPF